MTFELNYTTFDYFHGYYTHDLLRIKHPTAIQL